MKWKTVYRIGGGGRYTMEPKEKLQLTASGYAVSYIKKGYFAIGETTFFFLTNLLQHDNSRNVHIMTKRNNTD